MAHVVPGSPAARSGLVIGDRIYQVDGHDFSNEENFVGSMKSRADRVSLLVERDGHLRIVTLEARQSAPAKRAA